MILLLRMEITLLAISISVVLLLNTRRNASMLLDEKIFQAILYSSLVSIVFDALTWLIDGQTFMGAHFLAVITNMIYFVTCVGIPYAWLLYVQFRLTNDENTLQRKKILFFLPFLVFLVLLFITPVTGWIFYIDDQNVYHRGSLYIVQIMISMFYLIYPSIRSLQKGLQTTIASERSTFMTMASFTIYPILAAIIQFFFYGLPIVSFATVLSELIIFINVQNQQISLDALTNINNRRQFNRYLDIKIKSPRKGKTLYMLLLDIDSFKSINDTWGHKAGDQALINMARFLKTVCEKYHGFVARYGGDEFAIVLECKNEKTVKKVMASIDAEIQKFNHAKKAPYTLASSIGYAEFGLHTTQTADQLIEAADNKMYQIKTKRQAKESAC